MKLPIRRIPGTTPPKFEYFVTVNLPNGGTQAIQQVSCVSPSMEAAFCDLLRIAEQLAKENEILRGAK
jgi:hypothetical protein